MIMLPPVSLEHAEIFIGRMSSSKTGMSGSRHQACFHAMTSASPLTCSENARADAECVLAQVSDTGVFALQALTGLQRLTLAGCSGVGNGAVGALAKMTSLQHLDLHWCSFGDKGEPFWQIRVTT